MSIASDLPFFSGILSKMAWTLVWPGLWTGLWTDLWTGLWTNLTKDRKNNNNKKIETTTKKEKEKEKADNIFCFLITRAGRTRVLKRCCFFFCRQRRSVLIFFLIFRSTQYGLMTRSLLSDALFNGGFDCRPS